MTEEVFQSVGVGRWDYIRQQNQTLRRQETMFIICWWELFSQLCYVRLLFTWESYAARGISVGRITAEYVSFIRRFPSVCVFFTGMRKK